jgi:hypothetical protein
LGSNMQVMAQKVALILKYLQTELCVNNATELADTSALKFKISHPTDCTKELHTEGHLTSHMWVATLPTEDNKPIQTLRCLCSVKKPVTWQ